MRQQGKESSFVEESNANFHSKSSATQNSSNPIYNTKL